MLEKRSQPRARSMFKSAYIRSGSSLEFVTLRNISESGACFDSWPGATEGAEIEFCIDEFGQKKGTVCWIKDGLCGVNLINSDTSLIDSPNLQKRSVRLPLSVLAEIYVDGRRENVVLQNISLRGACIASNTPLAPGMLVSLRISGVYFELANVRWVRENLCGLRFATPVHLAAFRDLVARIQKPPAKRASTAENMGDGSGDRFDAVA